jgi:8-oxo-dGTP pyrophosphatase MutT (NUDIX family)
MTTRILLDSRKFRVEAVEVPDREGRTRTREVVRHPGAVVILPLLPDGRVLLIRNRRFAVNATLYELPAGTREPGEADDVGALRELEEETGYQARTLSPLVRFYASPGFCDEEMIGFVASDLDAERAATGRHGAHRDRAGGRGHLPRDAARRAHRGREDAGLRTLLADVRGA